MENSYFSLKNVIHINKQWLIIIFKWIKLLNIFKVSVSFANLLNTHSYNLNKQSFWEALIIFSRVKGSWDQNVWESVDYPVWLWLVFQVCTKSCFAPATLLIIPAPFWLSATVFTVKATILIIIQLLYINELDFYL